MNDWPLGKKLAVFGIIVFAMILIFVALLPRCSQAATWFNTNQATVAWDPVDTLTTGDPLPATDTVDYNIYTQDTHYNSAPVLVAEGVTDTQYVLTFQTEGRHLVGVQAVRHCRDPDGTEWASSPSTISWSDDPVVCNNGETFGIMYLINPAHGDRLRVLSP